MAYRFYKAEVLKAQQNYAEANREAFTLRAEVTRLESALAAMTRERDELAAEAEHLGKRLFDVTVERDKAEAKLEAVEDIVAQAITDPYLIAHLEAALATTGPSLRQRVTDILAYVRIWMPTEDEIAQCKTVTAQYWFRGRRDLCMELEKQLEAALKGEGCPKS